MNRRTGIAGLTASLALLGLTLLLVAGVSLPGPPLREWLGIAKPPLPDLCAYDPASVREPPGPAAPPGSWRREPSSPTPSPEEGAIALGGYIYMVGGQLREGTEATVLRFDPRSGEYRRMPDLPVAIDHPVVAKHDGELIVAGGYADGTTATNRVWAFSPRSRRWRELPPMRTPRGAAAGATVGDRLYVAGGLTEFGSEYRPLRSMEIYDFGAEAWKPGPPIPTARHHFGAAAIGGKVYFAGGREPGDFSVAALEGYDPRSMRWRRLPPMPVGAGAPGVTATDGRLVVTGGGEDTVDGAPGGWVLRTAYAYDPRRQTWRRLPDMLLPRHGHAAAAVGGRVYALRGIPCPGYGESSAVESLKVG